ncbi:MAG TPA: hypothetical protein VFK78_05940 [Gemmatimonadales bacterium]|nr:hypothetical protein [Gemmatimonadales bacterium]
MAGRDYQRLAEIEVDAVTPDRQGFQLAGAGSDHAEYRLDLRFDLPLDPRTRSALGELLLHSELTIARRAPEPLAGALRARRDGAHRR